MPEVVKLSMNSAWPGHPQDVTSTPSSTPWAWSQWEQGLAWDWLCGTLEWPAILSSIRRGQGGHHLRHSLDLPALPCTPPPTRSRAWGLQLSFLGLLPVRRPLHPPKCHQCLLESPTGMVMIPFSKGSSQPRDWTWVSCIAGEFFTVWVTRKAPQMPQKALQFEPERDAHKVGFCPQSQLVSFYTQSIL